MGLKNSEKSIQLDQNRMIDYNLMALCLPKEDQKFYLKREGPPLENKPKTEKMAPQKGHIYPKPEKSTLQQNEKIIPQKIKHTSQPKAEEFSQQKTIVAEEGSTTEEETDWTSILDKSDPLDNSTDEETQYEPIPLESRRKLYVCGNRYVSIDKLPNTIEAKQPQSESHLYKPDQEINQKIILWRGNHSFPFQIVSFLLLLQET